MLTPTVSKIIFCIILTVLTYSTLNTILDNDFIDYDDGLYITENQYVRSGLNWASIKWAFQTTQTGNWIPLTWLSHMLAVELFDIAPGKHHMVDLILHCLNAILLFLILHKTTGSPWASFLAALLFAIHPLRVESVAWVSERKDTLSTFFGLWSLVAYVSYANNKKISVYCLTCVFLILGLMAKAMLVTWPFVFLLFDYWPLGRFNNSVNNNISCTSRRKALIRLITEKAPFLCIVFVFCIIAYKAQQAQGAVVAVEHYSLLYHFENYFISYIGYLKQIFFPVALGVFYPLSPQTVTHTKFLISLVVVSCATVFFFRRRNRNPYALFGWLWFLGTLIPVSGLVQIGSQAMADRYTYIPAIGISIAVSFAAAELARRGQLYKITISAAASLIVCILIFLTWIQTAYWKNSLTLYSHTLNVTQNNYIMHINYGCALAESGDFDSAMTQFMKASELFPNAAAPREKIASVHIDKGDYEQAIHYLEQALTKKNANPYEIYVNSGRSYTKLGQLDAAIDCYRKAVNINPRKNRAFLLLAEAYESKNEFQTALDYYTKALEMDNTSALCLNKLAMFYVNKKSPFYSPSKALDYSQQACRLTQFRDAETLMLLIRILELDKKLEAGLSRGFMDDLNKRMSELKTHKTRR
jgi:Tfp pilus assembly protein PilF